MNKGSHLLAGTTWGYISSNKGENVQDKYSLLKYQLKVSFYMKSSKNNAISILVDSEDLLYYNKYLLTDKADHLYQQLIQTLNWTQQPIRMFGKTFLQPRLIAWYGDKGIQYRYSQTTLTAQGWTKELKQLQQKLNDHFQLNFNSVLANLYRNGQDSMGWHSDDEKELGPQPVIAALSLGAPRKIQFRRKGQQQQKVTILLEHGSLLIMKGAIQEEWQHQIAKTKKIHQPRINLTFRIIQPNDK